MFTDTSLGLSSMVWKDTGVALVIHSEWVLEWKEYTNTRWVAKDSHKIIINKATANKVIKDPKEETLFHK